MDQYYAGIDLHSTNSVIGIIDNENRQIFKKKIRNDLQRILHAFEPYREQLQGAVVESTYNWYCLVDGLMESGYRIHLANPSKIKQYEGLKYKDDVTDALHLANLLRLGILPEGYIYPKQERPVRDLLRKRLRLVQQKTSNILSFQNLVQNSCCQRLSANKIRKLTDQDVVDLLGQEHRVLSGQASIRTMHFLADMIAQIEKVVRKAAKLRAEFKKLKTVPGIWDILALTIMLETGPIDRFAKVGNYASYCRCVNSKWLSNGKKKGQGNERNGNRYLSWAYVEAANHALWNYDYVKRYYQKKMAKTNHVVAIKTIAHKLARACYYIIRDQVEFDPQKVFV
ncbi:IS110 family transposase [Thermodesulfobacteriota bacterium]